MSFFVFCSRVIVAQVSKESQIAIVTISTPNRQEFSRHTIASMRKYADLWGYDFYHFNETFDPSRPAPWSKILAARTLLLTNKYQWVVWIDDDIYITDPSKSLEYFIHKCPPETYFIISSHKEFVQNYNDVNTGLFFVKNSPWSQEFLGRVWDIGNYRYNQDGGSNLEQSAMSDLLTTPEYKDSCRIAKFPARTIQSFITLILNGDYGDYGQWQPGDFAAHLAGASITNRIFITRQFAKDVMKYPTLHESFRGRFTVQQDQFLRNNRHIVVGDSQKNNAVMPEYSGGRFGDNLMTFANTLYFAMKNKTKMLHIPFKFSEELMLDTLLAKHSHVLEKTYVQKGYFYRNGEALIDQETKNTLFIITHFPASRLEYIPEYALQKYLSFDIDWNDKNFKESLRMLVAPKKALSLITPRDGIPSVAVHVRKGIGFDDPSVHTDRFNIFRFPPDEYYVSQIKALSQSFNHEPLYLFIFTDDPNPQALTEKYKKLVNIPTIEFACRTENHHTKNVLEDFFSILDFAFLIRPESNFSIMAEKMGYHLMVISPEKPLVYSAGTYQAGHIK